MKLFSRLIVCVIIACLSACNTYEDELSSLKEEIETIKKSLEELNTAYNEGKIITSVTPIESDGLQAGGWKITFSDESTIVVNSGKDGLNGVTPYVKIDNNKNWIVSYDNGETYTAIVDKDGNPIASVGKDGEDGNSVRVVTNDQSYYVIEIYNVTTGEVVDSIVTKYSSNPRNIVKSIVEDDAKGVISMTMENGEVFIFKQGEILSSARIISFKFLAKNNPVSIISGVECEIIGDSLLSCFIPYIIDDRNLVPTFECVDAEVMLNDEVVKSGETLLDCSMPVTLQVVSEKATKKYTLQVRCFTGLPIVYINTEGKKAIDSKDDYVKGIIRVVSNNVNGIPDFESTMKIKGRGNSTWQMPKKPYKIKFDSKVSLLGEPADKEWVLLANYADKTQLRNEIAFFMGELSCLDYTPRTNFVEVVINGVYNGTYQLGEQLKIGKNRVNVGDDGYLLEIDARATADDITFIVDKIPYPINIKDPDMEVGSDAYNYVVDYLNQTAKALYADDFADPENGYQKYLDVNSFVDWYIINEITKNTDAVFFSSCYMNLSRDGKLKMGPLWDYDIAFGNVNYNTNDDPEGFYICTNVSWYRRLFADAAFVKLVQERFEYFYSNKEVIFNEINRNAEYLQYAAVENNNKWGVLYEYTWPNNEILGSYQNEVQSMKNWFHKRMEWLKVAFSEM
jgi:hypothetical protein